MIRLTTRRAAVLAAIARGDVYHDDAAGDLWKRRGDHSLNVTGTVNLFRLAGLAVNSTINIGVGYPKFRVELTAAGRAALARWQTDHPDEAL